MDSIGILTICIISFIVSIFTISIGGTSLITVPALISLGMISKNAIATNMFALIFLSISGAIGFKKEINPTYNKIIVIFSILTILGSIVGANLILAINKDALKRIIAITICIIAGLFLFKKDLGIQDKKGKISKIKLIFGSLLIFILGIYGGFFSGGYVTLLSYVLILTFCLTFLQAAFITKILNIFSSLAACIFFYYHNLINLTVGIPLAFSMFLGGLLGAKLAIAKGNAWIRNLFVITAITLAIKLLFF